MINVGIVIFDEVEVLDFTGPFEVFSISEDIESKDKLFNVFTFAENKTIISARNGLEVMPKYSIFDSPEIDILIVPGGYGAEEIEIHNKILLTWLKKMENKVRTVASICTGAFLLAKSGIITNHEVTTHWMDLDRLKSEYPDLKVLKEQKFVDQGNILTSAGISAGIELSLYIVSKYTTKEIAVNTAKRMEYHHDFLKNT